MVGDLSADIAIDEFDWWYDGLVMGWDVRRGSHADPHFADVFAVALPAMRIGLLAMPIQHKTT